MYSQLNSFDRITVKHTDPILFYTRNLSPPPYNIYCTENDTLYDKTASLQDSRMWGKKQNVANQSAYKMRVCMITFRYQFLKRKSVWISRLNVWLSPHNFYQILFYNLYTQLHILRKFVGNNLVGILKQRRLQQKCNLVIDTRIPQHP